MVDRPNTNPTPKQDFQSNAAWIKMHREMMQQPMLGVSLQFALLQYQRTLCDSRTVDGNQAAQNHFKIQGAHEFLAILKNLGEMPEQMRTKIDNQKLTQ